MRQRKPDPVKCCAFCGQRMTRKRYGGLLEDSGAFARRKYCNLACMGKAKTQPPKSKAVECAQARRAVAAAGLAKNACEECDSCDHLGVHHMDGNRQNNRPSNVKTFCSSCHTKWHWQNGKQARQKPSCSVCGKPASGLGFCQKHYQRFKKHGDPLLVVLGGKKLQKVSPDFSIRG